VKLGVWFFFFFNYYTKEGSESLIILLVTMASMSSKAKSLAEIRISPLNKLILIMNEGTRSRHPVVGTLLVLK